ncbi:Uncharacterised protein [Bordetella pertussis]|nr:Uncharacterised protein [Bordetella pertussis]CFM91406.1 Uncharacterised protein [Bordetella pertussis]CFN29124.1 Uncharacterised protein [Bordetella pertussis]CFN46008.1 Uncharacterised protein [Bordetella pertussis]CFO00792.1 Uncharacterised protein [Bordetella pertussis]
MQAIQPGAPGQAGAPVARRVAAQGAHILQQALGGLVGQRQGFLVHYRIGKTVLDQQVAKIVHVHEGRRGRAQAGIGQRLAQLAQRSGTQAGKHRQPAHLEDAAPFGQDRVRLGMPVQGQVGPHQVQLLGRQPAGGQVGAHERDGGLAALGQASQPGGHAARRPGLARVGQQRLGGVQPGIGGARKAVAQQRQAGARAAAGVQQRGRLQPDIAQPAHHALRDFAIQELSLREIAAAGELAHHVGGHDGKRRQGRRQGHLYRGAAHGRGQA